jgi:hypothetical protein
MNGPTAREQATREARIRRAAQRQGLRLVKNRRRDHRALDYGTWTVYLGDVALDEGLTGASLDEVERFLTGEGR